MFIALNSRCGSAPAERHEICKTHMSLTERESLCGTFGYKHASPPELVQVSQVSHYRFSYGVRISPGTSALSTSHSYGVRK